MSDSEVESISSSSTINILIDSQKHPTRAPGSHRPIPPKSTSWIFLGHYFGLLPEKWAKDRLVCNLCFPIDLPDPTEESMNGKCFLVNCTTVAINHLRSKHGISKLDYYSNRNSKSQSISFDKLDVGFDTPKQSKQSYLTQHTVKPLTEFEQGWLNVSYVLNVVCRDLHAQSQIEGEGMRQFIDDLNLAYVCPSHTWVANILDQMGDLVREKIREKLSVYLLKTCYFKLAGSIDLWHSKGNDDYIGIIVSYIEPITFYHSVITIGVVEYTESHSGELIVKKINGIISSFGIPGYGNISELLYALSHDNCPKIVKGIRDFTLAISTRCGCHTVQLTPMHVLSRGISNHPHTKFISQANDIIQKARKIVGHFHHSAEANYNLVNISSAIDEPPIDLIQDNVTRWDSTHDLIGSVIKRFKSLKIYSLQHPGKISEFEKFEEEFLVHCYGVLSPFKWVTKILQGDYPTISIYYPAIKLLLKSLSHEQPICIETHCSCFMIDHEKLNPIATAVRENLLLDLENNIDTKFTEDQKELMGVSSFLDPRWKTLSFLENIEKERYGSLQIQKMWSLWNGDTYLKQLLEDMRMNSGSTIISLPEKIPKLNETIGNFMMSLLQETSSEHSNESLEYQIPERLGILATLEEEIKFYKGLPQVDVNADFILLEWWRDKGVELHKLFRLGYMASIAHANVASSSSVERLFSAAGRVVSRDRANTKPERVETILLVNKNPELLMED